MNVSIIMPVYNEEETLGEIIQRVQAVNTWKELIIIDDGSTDRSSIVLQTLHARYPNNIVARTHAENRGKGAAIRTGLDQSTGDFVLIQDADLEYDPTYYPQLFAPFINPDVKVVYGSRNLRPNPRSSFLYYWGGKLLTHFTNLIYRTHLTDITTGYKVFNARLLKDLSLETDGFEFCAEVTSKILRNKIPIIEVPISYSPRSFQEGKKLRWSDGLVALWTLLKYRLFG